MSAVSAAHIATIRKEMETCEEMGWLAAGSNTYYWNGVLDALAWVLGEGIAPSESDEEDDDAKETA
jgi:hypothetical protein